MAVEATNPPMPRRRCGAADLTLPVLGVGCFSFGGGSYWGEQSQRDVDEVVACALGLGVNFFDTAESYNGGASELALGQALRGRRDGAILCSKLQPDYAYRDEVRGYCEASLSRLKTDRLDVYMLHWPLNSNSLQHFTNDMKRLRNPPGIAEALMAMDELRREGKIRHIGLSNFGTAQLAEALAIGVPVVLSELPYNLIARGIEAEVLPACTRSGLGVLGYMSLAQGFLTGKFNNFEELPPMRTRTRHFRGDRPGSRHGGPGFETETLNALENLHRLADSLGRSMGDLALAWAVGNPAITCTLVGARNRAQLEANVRAAQISLSAEVRAEFDRTTEQLRQKLGTGIDYYQSIEHSRSW